MANIIYVRPAKPSDVSEFLEWEMAGTTNEFDYQSPLYKSSFTLCAFDTSGNLAFLPIQQTVLAPDTDLKFMLESICFRPEISDLTKASCVKELIQSIVFLGHTRGIGEIYFVGTDTSTNTLAEKYGFEKLPWPVYRLKLNQ
jgi:hypothetical protein